MRDNFRDSGFRAPPVSEGEEIDVTIEAVGEKGDGIAKKSGFVIFVPNTKSGDRVKVKITKVLKKVSFAEVVGAAAPAPEADVAEVSSDEANDEQPLEAPAEEDKEKYTDNF